MKQFELFGFIYRVEYCKWRKCWRVYFQHKPEETVVYFNSLEELEKECGIKLVEVAV